MEIEQKIVDFLNQNLHTTRAEYYINLFRSMSQQGFENRIEKHCYSASEHQRRFILGKLNNSTTILLIIGCIMEKRIEKRRNNLSNLSKINIHASDTEITQAKEEYAEAETQIEKALKDQNLVFRELCQTIEDVFKKEIASFVKHGDVLEIPPIADRAGRDFAFYGREVYVTNWYPMGGD